MLQLYAAGVFRQIFVNTCTAQFKKYANYFKNSTKFLKRFRKTGIMVDKHFGLLCVQVLILNIAQMCYQGMCVSPHKSTICTCSFPVLYHPLALKPNILQTVCRRPSCFTFYKTITVTTVVCLSIWRYYCIYRFIKKCGC